MEFQDDEPRGWPTEFTKDVPGFLSRLVQVLQAWGRALEVAVLASATSVAFSDDPEPSEDPTWYMNVVLPLAVHARLFGETGDAKQRQVGQRITEAARELRKHGNGWLRGTTIGLDVEPRSDWKVAAQRWLRGGDGTNNQGRVRSDNVAAREADGLFFRSEPEIHVYRALKASGVAFAPLPVFLRGGDSYQRTEPDFVVLADGAVMILEVDGDTVHVERPAEAEQRTRMFKLEGAFIERILASDCASPEKAKAVVGRILAGFAKWRAAR
jgi:hypothetical protein